MRRKQHGAVLALVAWLVVLGSLIVFNLSKSSRIEVRSASALLAGTQAQAAAESGIWLAVANMLGAADQRWPVDGSVIESEFDGAELEIRIQAQSGLLDLNLAPEQLLLEVFSKVLEDEQRARTIVDEILDWRDGDDLVRASGAEAEDYAALELAYGPRDGAFNSHEELRLLLGITADEYAALAAYVTVHSQNNRLQPEYAPEHVLRALPNMDDARVDRIIEERATLKDDSADEARSGARRRVLRSTAFEVFAQSRRGPAQRKVSAVVITGARGKGAYTILAWREGWYDRPTISLDNEQTDVDHRSD